MRHTADAKTIFITGGLGFVGRHVSEGLLRDGHRVTAVGRTRNPSAMIDHPFFTYMAADTTRSGAWQTRARDSDVVVNLAGKSIFTRWTRRARQAIRDSRILTTRHLVEALAGADAPVLLSASAVGYYGDRGEDVLTESEPPGDDFLAKLGLEWENEALALRAENGRVALTRFGIVLGPDGGALAMMIPAFRLFLGGRLGSGRQWFPWIHVHDLVRIFRFLIENDNIAGPVNCCAPQPVRNRQLTRTLAHTLDRPAVMPAPAFAVKAVLGEFGESLLYSMRVSPAVLKNAGYTFAFPDLESALQDIVAR